VTINQLRARHRPVQLAPAALRAIMRYPWPRNIRELEQALAAAIALERTASERAPSPHRTRC
jgi:DNA-binding NtrC family response regulator